eukprot:690610-Prorocentrum_minimum.AAC.1
MGLGALSVAEGLGALRSVLMHCGAGQVMVASRFDWKALGSSAQQWRALGAEFDFPSQTAGDEASFGQLPGPVGTAALSHHGAAGKVDMLGHAHTMIKQAVVGVLGCEVDDHEPLMAAGIDSLGATELRNGISSMMGLSLPATLMFDYPTMSSIVDYVVA